MRFVLAFLAVLGIAASVLALREHYRTDTSPCSINEKWDCGIVNHSPYAVLWGVPVATDVLVRLTATAPQTDLDAPARRRNVRKAFAVHHPEAIAGRHIVLVDDVLTTGATAGECARVLLRAGAATVGVVTVARAL